MSEIAAVIDPLSLRVWRLFFEESRNTMQIAGTLGIHEAAADRLVNQIMDMRRKLQPPHRSRAIEKAKGSFQ